MQVKQDLFHDTDNYINTKINSLESSAADATAGNHIFRRELYI